MSLATKKEPLNRPLDFGDSIYLTCGYCSNPVVRCMVMEVFVVGKDTQGTLGKPP